MVYIVEFGEIKGLLKAGFKKEFDNKEKAIKYFNKYHNEHELKDKEYLRLYQLDWYDESMGDYRIYKPIKYYKKDEELDFNY